MKRSRSLLAQLVFDSYTSVRGLTGSSSFASQVIGKILNKFIFAPLLKIIGRGRLVSVRLYGHEMLIPAEHPLPAILKHFPRYNRPLGLAAEVISEASATDNLMLVDVGANIGETVAITELYCGGRYSYLCIEPEEDLAELCKFNHRNNDRVEVDQRFIGEEEGAEVYLQDDGRANPSTLLVKAGDAPEPSLRVSKLMRLDTVVDTVMKGRGKIALLKIDTEGYDFSVLRSGDKLLRHQAPAIYFEWFPNLLSKLDETVWGGFEYLAGLGYRYFVFFTSTGDYYCKVTDPDELLLYSLSKVALDNMDLMYFDVFASTKSELCDALVKRCSDAIIKIN